MKFVLRKECNFEVRGKMRSGLRLKTTKRKTLVSVRPPDWSHNLRALQVNLILEATRLVS